MNNINNAILIRRAAAVADILRELVAVQFGATDLFTACPHDLRLAYEAGLCLSVVPIQDLSAVKAMRYMQMLGRDIDGGGYGDGAAFCDEDWVNEVSLTPIEAYLYVGPPQTTVFFERSLSPARANFALAYEVGGYMGDLLSYRCLWQSPRSVQCASLWDAFDPDLAQHQLWFDLRALPRVMMPQAADQPSSALDLAMPYPSPTEIIARELLAPWAEVAAIFTGGSVDRHGLVSLLMARYGLPAAVAARYYNDLQTILWARNAYPNESVEPDEPCLPHQMQHIHWGEEPPDEPDTPFGF